MCGNKEWEWEWEAEKKEEEGGRGVRRAGCDAAAWKCLMTDCSAPACRSEAGSLLCHFSWLARHTGTITRALGRRRPAKWGADGTNRGMMLGTGGGVQVRQVLLNPVRLQDSSTFASLLVTWYQDLMTSWSQQTFWRFVHCSVYLSEDASPPDITVISYWTTKSLWGHQCLFKLKCQLIQWLLRCLDRSQIATLLA